METLIEVNPDSLKKPEDIFQESFELKNINDSKSKSSLISISAGDLEYFDIRKFVRIPKKFLFVRASNFFEAFSEALNDAHKTTQYNEEQLFEIYDKFCQHNPQEKEHLFEEDIGDSSYNEGKIICASLNQEMGIILVKDKDSVNFMLIDAIGKAILTEEIIEKIKDSDFPILLHLQQNSYFLPLLKNKETGIIQKSYKAVLQNLLLTSLANSSSFAYMYINFFICGVILKDTSKELFASSSIIRAFIVVGQTIFTFPLTAVSIIVGHDTKAEKPFKDIIRTVQSGWILALIYQVPTIIIFSTMRPILLSIRELSPFAEMVQSFFWPYLGGVTAYFLRTNTIMFLNGRNKRSLIIAVEALTLAVSIGLTYAFTESMHGLTLGATGFGIAQMIANLFFFMGCQLGLLLYKDSYLLYRPLFKYSKHIIKLLKLGLPFSIALLGEMGIFLSFSLMAGSKGINELIAQNIFTSFLQILLIPTLSIYMAISILSGRAFGGRKLNDLKRYMMTGLALNTVCPLIAIVLFSTLQEEMASIFINRTEYLNSTRFINNTVYANSSEPTIENITKILHTALPLTACGTLFDSIRLSLVGGLFGMQDAAIPALINAGVQLFVVIPLMYVLTFHTDLNVSGLLVAYIIGSLLLAVIAGLRLYHTFNEATTNTTNLNIMINNPHEETKDLKENFWSMSFSFFKSGNKKDEIQAIQEIDRVEECLSNSVAI